MFKRIRALTKGNKVAKEAAAICGLIVNEVLSRGGKVRVYDTIMILKCVHACCCALALDRRWMGEVEIGTICNHSGEILIDWLVELNPVLEQDENTKLVVAELRGEIGMNPGIWLNSWGSRGATISDREDFVRFAMHDLNAIVENEIGLVWPEFPDFIDERLHLALVELS